MTDDTLAARIGANLRALRTERGLSQRDLGQAAGATGTAVGNWETGTRQIGAEHLVNLAAALGVAVTRLLGSDGADPFAEGYAAGWAACRARMNAATGPGAESGAP
jgi:transcriptional regulator with XRE-family HTH domain